MCNLGRKAMVKTADELADQQNDGKESSGQVGKSI